MKIQKIYTKFASLEKEYAKLKKDFEKSAILHTENNTYLKSDKQAFLAIWKRYIRLFDTMKIFTGILFQYDNRCRKYIWRT